MDKTENETRDIHGKVVPVFICVVMLLAVSLKGGDNMTWSFVVVRFDINRLYLVQVVKLF